MDFDLKKLRTSKNIPAKKMVDIIKAIYPKYDKTVQSKCENGDAYGVCLRKDAADAIKREFAPEIQKKKDGHRLTCRISCRLENDVYEALQLNIRAEGYSTTQDWLSNFIKKYNLKKRKENKE